MSEATTFHRHGRLTSRAALASVATALLLLLLKGYAAFATQSVAMLASLADSGLDLVAALVTFYGVRVAAEPPDADHRFGHGKAEALAALFQTVLITVAALAIGWRGIAAIGSDAAPQLPEYGIAVSLIAIVATLALILYQRWTIRETGSIAIRADNVHYQSDLLLNASVIAALVLDAMLGLRGADPAFGIVIALWLIWSAWNAASEAIDQLMDKEWTDERRHEFLSIAATHPELINIHDFRTRTSGARDFVQFHVAVDPKLTVRQAHDVMEEVEHRLEKAFPGVEILIHVDPEGQIDEPDNPLAEADETANL